MIETDDKGQSQLDDLCDKFIDGLTEWETRFLNSILNTRYQDLTDKQKTTVSNMWEKYFK